MEVNNKTRRTIWFDQKQMRIGIIDQTLLPHHLVEIWLNSVEDVCRAIHGMQVRGAPLIGVTAAYGLALGLQEDSSEAQLLRVSAQLQATRPTAVNLLWALQRVQRAIRTVAPNRRAQRALQEAHAICEEDVQICSRIGDHGLGIIEQVWADKQARQFGSAEADTCLNILTHCNAGWLAAVEWGTALAPVYKACNAGLPVHVWVDETRPRNQGAQLTAWELARHGVPHTVITDNTGGHLMQHGLVDLCLVGSDRTTAHGDVCNKIGTYLKALAAKDNQLPFYVALPVSTIDWQLGDGIVGIPIEQRDSREVTQVQGLNRQGELDSVRISPQNSNACNYAFDVTPARLVSALITEYGVFDASPEGLTKLKALLS